MRMRNTLTDHCSCRFRFRSQVVQIRGRIFSGPANTNFQHWLFVTTCL